MNRVAGIEAAGTAHLQNALPAPWAGSVLPVSHMAQLHCSSDVVVNVVHCQELALAELAAGRWFPEVVVLQVALVSKVVGQVEVAAWTTEPSFRYFFLEKKHHDCYYLR